MRALIRYFSLVLLLALPASAAFAASAYVHSLSGTLAARVGPGPAIPLKIGDTFDPGVTLVTGANSDAVVKFEDGQVITLAPNTQFAVREYNYNKRSVRESNVVFALLRGGLRFVTGVIGATNRNAFKLNVGTATIGVRGTDGVVTYDDIANIITAATNAGALQLQNQGFLTGVASGQITSGSLTRGQTYASVAIAQATPDLTAAINSINAKAIPINTPVVVAASARAAAAQEAARIAQAAADAPGATQAQLELAQRAAQLAQDALNTAIAEAVNAFNAAQAGGGQIPAPPAPVGPVETGQAATTGQQGRLQSVIEQLQPPPKPLSP
ncbi:MAG: hypothetical protein A3H32_19290 [Betaproteobacteria bacterium RIFCSPLOWO2_02_FULL_63_19]|nr:MAG: hypothetical protein A3H32_19290 [Betaproteobacteria bacterium RIFCSPLOWO2_02_FULL_63_19]